MERDLVDPRAAGSRTTPSLRIAKTAVCPVEIPYRAIQAYTGSGVSIFEPFGGSGTTLIAAEKASRKAYVMELNPAYCDVTVKRWETLTGGKAVRVAGS